NGGLLGVGGIDRILAEESVRSARRAKAAARRGSEAVESGATASAILCAAAACEARLSEHLAHAEFAGGDLAPEYARIRQDRRALRQWRDLFRIELPEFSVGEIQSYRQLGCLYKLRDTVAHRNARLVRLNTYPELLRPCIEQRVLPVREQEYFEWTSVVLVHEVASWSAHTAREWLELVETHIPFRC